MGQGQASLSWEAQIYTIYILGSKRGLFINVGGHVPQYPPSSYAYGVTTSLMFLYHSDFDH